MKIVLVGAGEVGFNVAKDLSDDGYDITIIEENFENASRAEELLDVMVIRGNGARPAVLARAGISQGSSDVSLLIACTNRDEVNLMACWIAKRMGVPHVIARAVGLEFTDNESWARELGIDLLISPERSVARELEELLEVRAAVHANEIAGGKAGIYVFKIAADSPLVGCSLIEMRQEYPDLIMLIVCIKRDKNSFIPIAAERLRAGDLCYTMCYRSIILDVEKLFQPSKSKKLKRVFIVGAGKIGARTAKNLIAHIPGVDVRLIEEERAKCERLAAEIPEALVLCGNGSDENFLISEGIKDADGYVAVTENDEENLMLAVLAKTLGVSKSIAVVRKSTYLNMVNYIPVDAIVNRNQTLADVITRGVRYPGSSRVLTILDEINAEAMEICIPEDAEAVGKTLMEVKMPLGSLVGLLERENEILIPTGKTVLYPGDKIVLFGSQEVMHSAAAPFGGEKN